MPISRYFKQFGGYPDWLKNQYKDYGFDDPDIVLISKVRHDFVCFYVDPIENSISVSIFNTKQDRDNFVFYLEKLFIDYRDKVCLMKTINKVMEQYNTHRDKKLFVEDLLQNNFDFCEDSDSFDLWLKKVYGTKQTEE